MTNLVTLNLDKDTGEVIAKFASNTPTGIHIPGTVFVQALAITTWVINHLGNTNNVQVQVYDNPVSSGHMILPDDIFVNSSSQITITFARAQAGKATILFF